MHSENVMKWSHSQWQGARSIARIESAAVHAPVVKKEMLVKCLDPSPALASCYPWQNKHIWNRSSHNWIQHKQPDEITSFVTHPFSVRRKMAAQATSFFYLSVFLFLEDWRTQIRLIQQGIVTRFHCQRQVFVSHYCKQYKCPNSDRRFYYNSSSDQIELPIESYTFSDNNSLLDNLHQMPNVINQ